MQRAGATVVVAAMTARPQELDAHRTGLLRESRKARHGQPREHQRTKCFSHDLCSFSQGATTSRVRLPIGPVEGWTMVPSAAWKPATVRMPVSVRCIFDTSVAGLPRVA